MCNNNINSQLEVILGSYNAINELDDSKFINKSFNDAFMLIPEAEKGVLYELAGDRFVPVCSKGYEESQLSKLFLKIEEATIDFKCSSNQDVEAVEIYIESRDGQQLENETIKNLKVLGRYPAFPRCCNDNRSKTVCFQWF